MWVLRLDAMEVAILAPAAAMRCVQCFQLRHGTAFGRGTVWWQLFESVGREYSLVEVRTWMKERDHAEAAQNSDSEDEEE